MPAQPLSTALRQTAEKFGLTILFYSDITDGLKAPPLLGTFTKSEAFASLLEDSLLQFTFVNGASVAIRHRDSTNEEKSDMYKTTAATRPSTDRKPGFFRQLGAALAAILVASPAIGAEVTSDESEPYIEEIIVTATKRETSVQGTPLAITALTDTAMSRQGIENFEDFSRQVPGLILTGTKNTSKFTIRGVSTSTTGSSNGEQKPVAVYIDEVPVSSFSIMTPDVRLFDVERVEVLRGPQGTAFGSGSMGGGVRVITRKAQLDGLDASFRVDGGTTDNGGNRQRVSAMVNVPLIDDELAMRIVGYSRDEEGYVGNQGTWGFNGDNDEPVNSDWGIRASVRWEPSEALSATLMLMHDDAESRGDDSFDPDLGVYKVATFLTEEHVSATDNINLTVEYDLEWASLVSSTSYAEADLDFTIDLNNVLVGVMPAGFSVEQHQSAIVQEFRLVSTTQDNVEWMAGIFYLDRETDVGGGLLTNQSFLDDLNIDASALPNGVGPGVALSNVSRSVQNTESAVFGELTYHLSDTLSVSGGLYALPHFSTMTKGMQIKVIPQTPFP
jgi:iron complex outermembrane receptor protein